MTWLGKLISFFPIFNSSLVILAVLGFLVQPSLLSGLSIVFAIYAFPLICFHLHQRKFPIKHGMSDITKGYSPWYGSHMIQCMFITFPVFERVLRLIPGAFSFWLRLWGSQIGNNVYWTPHLDLLDRNLLVIGDNCVLGYNVKFSSHVVTPGRRHGLIVYVKPVTVKNTAFIGAECRIGPGVVIEENSVLPACTDVFPNMAVSGKVKPGESDKVVSRNRVTKK